MSGQPPRTAGRPALLRGERLPPEPVQARSRENRRRIKDAALQSFRDLGYDATTIDAIASRARVAVGGVYRHYTSKRQLLLALMDDLLQALAAVDFKPGMPAPRDAVRGLLRRAFDRDLEFLGVYRAWREAVLTDANLARKDRQIHQWTTRRIAAAFAKLQLLPRSRRGVNLDAIAPVMDRLYWGLLADALQADSAEFTRQLDVAADVTYHALFEDDVRRTR
jgi:AcrR family transcriptional regulator